MTQPINRHQKYHAHIYFDNQSLARARSIIEQVGGLFHVKVGRVHQQCVGPHPRWSCQLAFDADQFEQLIPWLDSQRKQLSILIHGVTANDLQDHTEYAYWLGEELKLNLAMFAS